MKHLIYILLLLTLQITLSHDASATNQARDIIIINKIEHRLNKVLLYQLDSVIYDALGKKLEFDKSSHSANWRGQISTFEVKGNKLYLNSIKAFKEHTDFNGLLDQYKDRKGRVFASWVSGTFICATGECIYVADNGFDSVHKQETELTVENGVVISSRTYTNKTHGTAYLRDMTYELPQEFNLSKIKAPKGRVTVKIDASRFNDEGKVTEWSVKFLSGHDNLTGEIKEMIVKEVNRVFNLVDWKTYSRDEEWHWLPKYGVTYPLIFQ